MKNTNLANKKFPNRRRGSNYQGMKSGTKMELFPPSLCSAPVKYVDAQTRKTYDMAFYGGITSIVQHDDLTVEPVLGWAVIKKQNMAK